MPSPVLPWEHSGVLPNADLSEPPCLMWSGHGLGVAGCGDHGSTGSHHRASPARTELLTFGQNSCQNRFLHFGLKVETAFRDSYVTDTGIHTVCIYPGNWVLKFFFYKFLLFLSNNSCWKQFC